MGTLYIDFETVDYGIQAGLGPGFPSGDVLILGAAMKVDDGPTTYSDCLAEPTAYELIVDMLRQHDTWVAHNAAYECQAARMMGVTAEEMKSKTIYCTMVGGKLEDNLLKSYSLDALAQKFLGTGKLTDTMAEEAINLGLIKPLKSYYNANPGTKAHQAAVSRVKNDLWPQLGRLQAASGIVAEYAIRDVNLCADLHKRFLSALGEEYKFFSRLVPVTVEMRMKGLRIDLNGTRELKHKLTLDLVRAERELWDTGIVFNYESVPAVNEWAESLGYPPVEDLKGKPGYGKNWIQANRGDHRVQKFENCKAISKAISFCESFLKYAKGDRLHPEMNIMEARTGRFSSKNPNIQQVPARDPELGPAFRSLFLPEEGDILYVADFSSQEPRLQVHYAELIGDASGVELAEAFRENPTLDLHSRVAAMAEISRPHAKTVNLGLSYGMGITKLAATLGVTEAQAKAVKRKYTKGAGYLAALNKYAQNASSQKGYIKTLLGRRSGVEPGFEYKALNKLIQGGAFDQTAAAMIKAYDEYGLVPLACIHDELLFSGPPGLEEVIKTIMETAVQLQVPSHTDVGIGYNWAQAK
jgi:DNA polymerase I-like protein with 3'-5' exonuclease and polymerase domains